MGSLNVRGILQSSPWKLREGVAILVCSLHLHAESALLRHGAIEAGEARNISLGGKQRVDMGKHAHVVGGQKSRVESDITGSRESVHFGVVGGHVDDRVAVRLGRDRDVRLRSGLIPLEKLTNGTPWKMKRGGNIKQNGHEVVLG